MHIELSRNHVAALTLSAPTARRADAGSDTLLRVKKRDGSSERVDVNEIVREASFDAAF